MIAFSAYGGFADEILAESGALIPIAAAEERDLLAAYGEAYRRYQQRVSMLLPVPKKWVIPGGKS